MRAVMGMAGVMAGASATGRAACTLASSPAAGRSALTLAGTSAAGTGWPVPGQIPRLQGQAAHALAGPSVGQLCHASPAARLHQKAPLERI
ncbi:hypothetical protein ACVNS2_06245 [Paenibacillus caseinilyticus]|uniref:hypothetical protein n=1 Tax=Paenibacillus mucilaginosus TaxID=61624 RepID=UPI000FFE7623|nr:hypothetical protein [Paenibacillus mucilaginosus]